MAAAVQVQRRRGTASQVSSFVGAQGELVFDTTNNRLRVSDGLTAGCWLALGMSPATIVEAMDASNVRHGGNIQFVCAEQLLSGLSGASVATTITLPNQCLVLGVSVRVTTAITGATSFSVGRTTGGSSTEYGSGLGTAAGTTNSGVSISGNYTNTSVTLTSSGGAFTGGAARVQFNYILLNPPTA